MKSLAKILTFGIVAGLLTILPFKESMADTIADVTFKSQYVASTGSIFSDKPSAYPSLTFIKNGFYGFLGANIEREEKVNEVDYMVGYNWDMGKNNLDVAAVFSDLRDFGESDLNDNFVDAQLKLKRKIITNTSLEVGVLQNIRGGTFPNSEGRDFNLALGYQEGSIPLELKADAHYNERYFSPKSDLSVVRFSAKIPSVVGKFVITPEILFQLSLDRENFQDAKAASISIGYAFN